MCANLLLIDANEFPYQHPDNQVIQQSPERMDLYQHPDHQVIQQTPERMGAGYQHPDHPVIQQNPERMRAGYNTYITQSYRKLLKE
jgi:hypothetical protein